MVRKFRIIGLVTGVEYSLNDFKKYLLTLPTNIGFEYENDFINVGSQRIRVRQDRKYNSITGTIEVSGKTRDEWEKNYNELRDFVASNRSKGFKLYYSNRSGEERYIICDLKILDKTEKSSYAILVPISLDPKSIWQQDIVSNTQVNSVTLPFNVLAFIEEEIDGNAYYNYGFEEEPEIEQHDAVYLTSVTGTAEITNNSDDETPVEITIYGACINPLIQLFDANNKEIQSCKIYTQLKDGEYLILNSDPENLSIIAYKNDGVESYEENLTTSVDISLTTFITLPIGTYTLRITEELNNLVDSKIKFSKRFIGG